MPVGSRLDPAVSVVSVCQDGRAGVLPSPLHSQLPAMMELFREWAGA